MGSKTAGGPPPPPTAAEEEEEALLLLAALPMDSSEATVTIFLACSSMTLRAFVDSAASQGGGEERGVG